MPLLALVHVHDLLRVDGQVLVRIDDDTEETGVRLQNGERFKNTEKTQIQDTRERETGN